MSSKCFFHEGRLDCHDFVRATRMPEFFQGLRHMFEGLFGYFGHLAGNDLHVLRRGIYDAHRALNGAPGVFAARASGLLIVPSHVFLPIRCPTSQSRDPSTARTREGSSRFKYGQHAWKIRASRANNQYRTLRMPDDRLGIRTDEIGCH